MIDYIAPAKAGLQNTAFQLAWFRLKTDRRAWFGSGVIFCGGLLLLASENCWWGYYLTAMVLGIALPIAGALHFALLAQSELLSLCAPSSKRLALVQCVVAIILCGFMSCAPLLMAPIADPGRLFVIVFAVFTACSRFDLSMMSDSKDAQAARETSTSYVSSLSCLVTIAVLWQFDGPTALLSAVAALPLLSLVLQVDPSHRVSKLLLSPLKTFYWWRLPRPIGQVNQLLDIRLVLNQPVISVALISAVWFYYLHISANKRSMYSGIDVFLVLTLGGKPLLTVIQSWFVRISKSAIYVLPIGSNDRALAVHLWTQVALLSSAFLIGAFMPRILFFRFNPESFVPSQLSAYQWAEMLAFMLLGTMHLILVSAYATRRRVLTSPDDFSWPKLVYAISNSIGLIGMCVVIVDFAKSGHTIPLWVTGPMLALSIFLNYRERALWLRDPAALWQFGLTKENR